MDKQKVYKYGGIGAIVIGSVLLFAGGVAETAVVSIVGGVFALVAVIVAVIKG